MFSPKYKVGEIGELLSGDIIGNKEIEVDFVSIDTREEQAGGLFIGIVGERFDGHDFVRDAAKKGAAAAMVNREISGLDIPQIVVGDTLIGLQELAVHHRRQFKGKVAAVTGSSGKTTTRSLLASILSHMGRTHQPVKNFNNHIGVPLTLLSLGPEFDMAVMELGCSDFGEIGLLTKLVLPDVGLVTNVGPAHLENLKDLDGVAIAKGELFLGLDHLATAVVNLDDSRVAAMPILGTKKLTFGTCNGVDVRLQKREVNGANGQIIHMDIRGESLSVFLPLAGLYNAIDAVAAAAAALAMGATVTSIRQGLQEVAAAPGRLEISTAGQGVLLIDDTYNANPASVRAALDVLAEMAAPNKRIAILGDMLELGERSEVEHMEIGKYAAAKGLKKLITMGQGAQDIQQGAIAGGMAKRDCSQVENHSGAVLLTTEISEKDDVLLIKGSRGMKMNVVVEALKKGAV